MLLDLWASLSVLRVWNPCSLVPILNSFFNWWISIALILGIHSKVSMLFSNSYLNPLFNFTCNSFLLHLSFLEPSMKFAYSNPFWVDRSYDFLLRNRSIRVVTIVVIKLRSDKPTQPYVEHWLDMKELDSWDIRFANYFSIAAFWTIYWRWLLPIQDMCLMKPFV